VCARALFHTAPRRVEIREVPAPAAAPGHVVVRTLCSGISGGTERLVFRGDLPEDMALDDTITALPGTFSYPFPYGYACVGQVDGQDSTVFAFHPHQDVFTAAAADLISVPGVRDSAASHARR
jgi:NADPH:quinone reductase-like Zn-dependent oxidoreductase